MTRVHDDYLLPKISLSILMMAIVLFTMLVLYLL